MTKRDYIPNSRPYIGEEEEAAIRQCLQQGKLSGDGRFTKLCEENLEQRYDAPRVLLTNSCTSALEMCAHLLNIGQDDEVIVPSYTFVSTANAFLLRGARIVFADIERDTFNLDPESVRGLITDRTRAIVPVHYAGVACDMSAFLQLSHEYNIPLVEDAAQGVHAKWKERYLGTIGNLGAYSFHDTKNFTSGEGGALVINDESLIERAEILREKGTNRKQFIMGQVDKYTWVDVGSSYLPSELNAALLDAQLAKTDEITQLRKAAHDRYDDLLVDLASRGDVQLPQIPEYAASNYHLYALLVPQPSIRDRLITFLNENGVGAVFHYIPLHSSPLAKRIGIRDLTLPVTDFVASSIVRLPLFAGISNEEQEYIVELIRRFFRK